VLRRHAEQLAAAAWRRLQRPPAYETKTGQRRARRENTKQAIVHERGYLSLRLDHEDVAEFTYRPGKCQRSYRVVVVRKNISRTRGDHALFDEIKYFFYITTYTDRSAEQIIELAAAGRAEQADQPTADRTAEQVVELANDRCDQENIIGQLKSGIAALRVPLYDLLSNWAYMLIAALAWNIKAWFALMMHRKTDRHDYIRMEFHRFFHSVVLIPAMILRRARGITVRLVGYTPALNRLFSAWTTIERLRFG